MTVMGERYPSERRGIKPSVARARASSRLTFRPLPPYVFSMADLQTSYLGIALKNPIIAGASDLTADLDGIRRIEEAGAGAIVLRLAARHGGVPRVAVSPFAPRPEEASAADPERLTAREQTDEGRLSDSKASPRIAITR